jgi:hypothetical protein
LLAFLRFLAFFSSCSYQLSLLLASLQLLAFPLLVSSLLSLAFLLLPAALLIVVSIF